MGLVNERLVAYLAQNALVAQHAAFTERDVLGDWLQAQGAVVERAADAIAQYFGVPYKKIEAGDFIREVPPLFGVEGWALYQLVGEDVYYCLRPPAQLERAAFHRQYGEAMLYVTDAILLHSHLLRDWSREAAGPAQSEKRRLSLAQLQRQAPGHVDATIGRILADAIASEATDVHLYKMRDEFRVVFRTAGVLSTYAMMPPAAADALTNKLKLLAEMDIAEHRLPQDGHILFENEGAFYNLRIATLPLYDGEKVVLRILPETQRRTSFSELGFLPEKERLLKNVLAAQKGMVLITGPTNSGKTTTLYACLTHLIGQGISVYTIEDPIEAVLPEVQQMQVNEQSGFTFARGLRGILRGDPDVIAVGELRDAETVGIAARAALSGQLVIATLHAFDAQQTVNRLRDLGLSDRLLSAVVALVINQRLVKKPCAACAGTGMVQEHVCPVCMGAGYHERAGVQEIWLPDAAAKENIERGQNGASLRAQALADGFVPLAEDARIKGLSLLRLEG